MSATAKELTDGSWRPVGGVLRWQPADQAQPAEERHRSTLTPAAVARMIACPTCHARVDRVCQTSTGRNRDPHKTRLIPRRCGCGELLASPKKVCDSCRDEARRINGRIGMRNTRARRRAAREAAA